jgi:hypothetical protein
MVTEHTGKDGGAIGVELSPLEAARRIAFALRQGMEALAAQKAAAERE